MAPPDNKEHACDWQDYAHHLEKKLKEQAGQLEEQAGQLEERATDLEERTAETDILKEQLAAMKRRAFGKKSEKLPSLERETRKQKREEDRGAQKAEALRKRRENEVAKTKLETIEVDIPVPKEQCTCPACGNERLKSVGKGKTSTIIDYVPGYFRRRVYRRQTVKCTCGKYIVTAPPPEKASEGSRYSEGFVAHLMVSKCADSIPLYRLEKQYKRAGLNISRATMNELLHRHAELLVPLCERIFERIAEDGVVLADETSIKLLHQSGKAWIWVFIANNFIGYRFSKDRSGKTPREVLGSSEGTLLVDAYTGYNSVTGADGRTRAGCLAHARRKIFEARDADSSAEDALDLIRRVYRVEHDAKEHGIAQSEEHLALRKKRAAPAMEELHKWLDSQKDEHPPKSAMGKAIGYALNNWTELTRFLEDARIPVDNNRSEGALRVVALGRKNFLFVGSETAGKNIAGLYSLIATCDACGVNPLQYLTDVMRRVSSHPASQIDELLPDRWKPAT